MTANYATEAAAVAEAMNAVYENKQQNKKDNISGDFSSDTASYPTVKAVKGALEGKLDKTHTSYKSKNVVTDSSGNITFEDKPTIPDVSGKIDTAGTGLSKSGTTLNHSNSVTAVTTAAFKKIKFDAQGHITGVADVSASDLPSHTHSYAASTHTHAASEVTDSAANGYTGIGTLSSGASQADINAAISSKLAALSGIDVINVVDDKGTASASTMHKLYIEVGQNSTDIYYTKATTSNGNTTYAWASLDTDILDNITLPTDVSDLTDNSNTAFTPKSHTHGNLSNDGKLGTTSGKPVITTTGGAITTGSFGSTAGTFAEGNHTHSSYVTTSDVQSEISAFATALAAAINPSA